MGGRFIIHKGDTMENIMKLVLEWDNPGSEVRATRKATSAKPLVKVRPKNQG